MKINRRELLHKGLKGTYGILAPAIAGVIVGYEFQGFTQARHHLAISVGQDRNAAFRGSFNPTWAASATPIPIVINPRMKHIDAKAFSPIMLDANPFYMIYLTNDGNFSEKNVSIDLMFITLKLDIPFDSDEQFRPYSAELLGPWSNNLALMNELQLTPADDQNPILAQYTMQIPRLAVGESAGAFFIFKHRPYTIAASGQSDDADIDFNWTAPDVLSEGIATLVSTP